MNRDAPAPTAATRPVWHVAYQEEHYLNAEACMGGIRRRLDLGWNLSQIRGPRNGPFAVIYRKEDGA